MKVLIAPDKFKGSLSAREVCTAIADGIRSINQQAEVAAQPMADGGDGSLDVLTDHLGLRKVTLEVSDPLGRPISAAYSTSGSAAFIEMAAAAGLVLLQPAERDPLATSTYGFGQLIAHAIQSGVKHIYLLLGGSATNDAGMGALQALGYRFLDEAGKPLPPKGAYLAHVAHVQQDQVMDCNQVTFHLLCDVDNVLFGPQGAAHVYAPQKGANPAVVEQLDQGLRHFASVVDAQFSIQIGSVKGGGAAGGIAASFHVLLGARLVSGFQVISELVGLAEKVRTADVVVTGEGRLDDQSLQGKVIQGVAQLARQFEKPCYILAGKNELSSKALKDNGIAGVAAILDDPNISLEQSMQNPRPLLVNLSAQYYKSTIHP